MPEYAVLRTLLAVLELSVAVLVVRRDAGHLMWWAAYCYWAGAADLVPAALGDPGWWRAMWMPTRALLLILLAVGVIDAYRFLVARTSTMERLMLACIGMGSGGILLIPMVSTWVGADSFQVFTRGREFIALLLAVGHSAAWYAIRVVKPVECPAIVRRHGLLLCCWLWVYWLAAAGAKGGTVWLVTPWEGGGDVWRWLNAGCTGAQVLMMTGWCFSLLAMPASTARFQRARSSSLSSPPIQ